MQNQTVAIVYHSGTGNTAQLALHIASGIKAKQMEVLIIPILSEDIKDGRYGNEETMAALHQADAIIFGSPTYMGSVSAQFKAFADASSEHWPEQRWAGKLAAGFTIGSNPGGDQLNTIQYFSILANQHGMIWSGINIPGGLDPNGRNRMGSQSGLITYTRDGIIDPRDLETARYLGYRIASLLTNRQPNRATEDTEKTQPLRFG